MVLWGCWTTVSSVVVVRVTGLVGSTTTVLQDENVRSAATAIRDAANVFMRVSGFGWDSYFRSSVTVVVFFWMMTPGGAALRTTTFVAFIRSPSRV